MPSADARLHHDDLHRAEGIRTVEEAFALAHR